MSKIREIKDEIKESVSLPTEDFQDILKNNVYELILYGAPFQLVDEYAYYSKEYTSHDQRRITGAICAVYQDKIRRGHTFWSRIDDEKKDNRIVSKGSIHELATQKLLESKHLFQDQKKIIEWKKNNDHQSIPRIKDHLFYASLENVNQLKLFNRKIFEFSEYNNKKRLIHLPSYFSENQIAKRIFELLTTPISLSISGDVAKRSALQKGADIEQANAVRSAVESKASVITGYAGTGKSKTIELLVNVLLDHLPHLKIRVCAPTGIATQRLQELFNENQNERIRQYFKIHQPSTIHRLLKIQPSRSIGICRTPYSYKKHPLDADVLIVDEASMVDVYMMRSLLGSIDNHTHVVIVGDSNQLNSVGAGRILYDLTTNMEKLKQRAHIPVSPACTVLESIHRTDGNSSIDLLANTLLTRNKDERWTFFREQLKESISKGDVHWIAKDDPVDIRDQAVEEYIKLYKEEKEVSLITPRHETTVGRIYLNQAIQQVLMKDTGFIQGTKIIQNHNDYEYGVFNGEVGWITEVTKDSITAEFSLDRQMTISKERAEKNWLIGFCSTVHKCQGIESDYVILPIWTENKLKIWNRTLLYTALTRSKKKIIIIGNDDALENAVKKQEANRITIFPIFYRNINLKHAKEKVVAAV